MKKLAVYSEHGIVEKGIWLSQHGSIIYNWSFDA